MDVDHAFFAHRSGLSVAGVFCLAACGSLVGVGFVSLIPLLSPLDSDGPPHYVAFPPIESAAGFAATYFLSIASWPLVRLPDC